MRRMKYKIGAFCLLAIGLWGCLEDKGVYDYDFGVAPEIKIDTVGTDKTELLGNRGYHSFYAPGYL